MDWLTELLWGRSTPRRLAGQNPIHAWLDAFDIPWRESRGDLIARYGVTPESDRLFESVQLDVPRAPIEGLIRPLYVQLSPYFQPECACWGINRGRLLPGG